MGGVLSISLDDLIGVPLQPLQLRRLCRCWRADLSHYVRQVTTVVRACGLLYGKLCVRFLSNCACTYSESRCDCDRLQGLHWQRVRCSMSSLRLRRMPADLRDLHGQRWQHQSACSSPCTSWWMSYSNHGHKDGVPSRLRKNMR